MNAMKLWMNQANASEQLALARLAHTSREYLYQLSSGTRVASAEIAGRIEASAKHISDKKPDSKLPVITRADLAPACAKCPYAKKCLS